MRLKQRVQVVLLRSDQVEELRRIQEKAQKASPCGVAPTIHEIARGIMGKALGQMEATHHGIE
ncbi:hypothetical protein [Serratia aquatilis]|uniref:Uncharacterized protein n=1 Tax=Serratia aquatilis TaxID=1737515 RepID=A0ABV6EGX1_9GAMM